jgi:hypothetical protein
MAGGGLEEEMGREEWASEMTLFRLGGGVKKRKESRID